jgi:AcrR family transcriptional regulator
MNDRAAREIISRRNRPAKAPLSRDVIVSTALGILEKDGLAGLSLRRLATALDTGAASLYVYLANLDELYALMLDRALAAVKLPEPDRRPWRDRLKEYLVSYLHVLYEKQGLAHLAMSTVATGPNSLRMWEVLLGLLKEAGIGDASLVAGVDMLLLHVTSIAAEESNRRAVGRDASRIPNALAGASAEEFPLVSALFQKGMFAGGEDDDAQVRWALDALIDGIMARQTGSLSQPTKKSSV